VFEGFGLDFVDVGEVCLRVRTGGEGPPVLLVHGHPRTHTTWWEVAPGFVEAGFSVVFPDLRGYGESTAPPDRPDHAQASKRAMAGDLVALMQILGHDRFHAVGHDRGGYVVQRLALDRPGHVDRVVILGDVPIGEALARCDARFATAWENYADVARAVANPAVQHAMCEDYRAGLGVDRDADDSDRAAGRQIGNPLLVLWGNKDNLAEHYGHDVLGVWRPWAPAVTGHALDTGHHMMEDAPEVLTTVLIDFLNM
jgi:haloacetate dehalogenase